MYSIHECRAIAESIHDEGKICKFTLIGNNKATNAYWIDPYMGLFQIEDGVGLLRAADFSSHFCLNVTSAEI